MRKYASAEERAAKTQKTTVLHFGFTEKVYGLPCTVRTLFIVEAPSRNAIVGTNMQIFIHVITKVTFMMFDDVPNSIIATMHSAAE